MINSIHGAIWEWFLGCAEITKLFFNFSEQNDGDTAIIPTGDTLIEEYIDGTQRRRYAFELARYLPITFAENDAGNVEMMEDVDAVVKWVEAQNGSGKLPKFPENYNAEQIEALDSYTGYAATQDPNTAKYMVPFAIEYTKGR